MSMEIMLRYIVGIAIAYGIGKWIYQSIRSRSIDYFLLAIIALMGAVLWLSRGFLLGGAHVTALASRPKLIGGARAEYLADPIRKN